MLGGQQDLEAGLSEWRERREREGKECGMDVSYPAVHSKESLARPWETGVRGMGGQVGISLSQSCLAEESCLPGTGLPWYPSCAQSWLESSPWEVWP